MKKYTRIAIAAAAVLLGILAIGLSMLPDQIPMHYNSAGEADRIGSKYEILLFPAVSVVLCAAFLAWAYHYRTDTAEGKLGQKVLALTAIFELVLMFVLAYWTMWMAGRYVAEGESYAPAVNSELLLKSIVVFLGIMLILLGNYMPKARKNALFGVRTAWTMENETVWQKSQRFAGITGVAFGFVMLILAVCFSGMTAMVVSMVLTLGWAVLGIVMSWRYYKEETAKQS